MIPRSEVQNRVGGATEKSRALNIQAKKYLPGGVARTGAFGLPYPIYCESGVGSKVQDIDGNSYIDFHNCFSSLIHGHCHPKILRAISEQLKFGTCFSGPTIGEVRLAEQLCSRSEALESVRFVNSGSEAVMTAIKIARAYTGRRLVAKCRGAYHGSYDYVEISVGLGSLGNADSLRRDMFAHHGVSQGAFDEVILIDFNDVDRSREALSQYGKEIAAVIFDPVPNYAGLIPANPDYVQFLREFTARSGALFISDEVVNFRQSFGGGLAAYKVFADIYCLGKVIGGGTSIGAVGGRHGFMSMLDPSNGVPAVIQSGTFSGNPLSMAAGAVSLSMLTTEVIQSLNVLGDYARQTLAQALSAAAFPTCVTGAGSLFRLHFRPSPIRVPQDACPSPGEAEKFNRLVSLLQDSGFLLTSQGMGSLSTPMGKGEIDNLAAAIREIVTSESFRG